ncbi:hypothetical protein [Sphingomonas sanxanigenens]|uniref:TIR domain-containing protein n=1 Tax=Sphingomonas sanxanigenens DSM 19645 = NX02 TaxID=1123269 RepID=W0A672_9SPHN|nr:hypothetical protein [Sphingomonas sanxanigenens]AHE52536.1 hypothetical protein NX02_03915 [Sphingomonas sanxanigenens DSM 19645 = NX02]
MAGVLISCTRADDAVAGRVARGLAALGIAIEQAQAAPVAGEAGAAPPPPAAVLALWTPASINSDLVWDDAGAAQKRGALVNLLWGAEEPPFMFGAVPGIALDGWQGGGVAHAGWHRLGAALEALGLAAPGALTQAMVQTEAEARTREAAVAAETDSARRKALRAELDDWAVARGAAGHAPAVVPVAAAEPSRPLSLFIPAERLAEAGLALPDAQTQGAVPAGAGGGDAGLGALTAAVARALATGPDGMPLGRVVPSPLQPPPVVARGEMAPPLPRDPVAKSAAVPAKRPLPLVMLVLAAVAMAALAAIVWFLMRA